MAQSPANLQDDHAYALWRKRCDDLTKRSNELTNDFFVNLLDMSRVWKPISEDADLSEGSDRKTGERRWTASRVDLIFGSNSQRRTLAEVYASSDGEKKFVE